MGGAGRGELKEMEDGGGVQMVRGWVFCGL